MRKGKKAPKELTMTEISMMGNAIEESRKNMEIIKQEARAALIQEVKNAINKCQGWDEDGKAYILESDLLTYLEALRP